MKKTAVDLFFDEVKQHFEFSDELMLSANFAYAMAKVEEKEQIIQAHCNGQAEFHTGAFNEKVIKRAEQYYLETFNQY